MVRILARTTIATCAALLATSVALAAEEKTFEVTIDAGAYDRANAPVSVPILLPLDMADATTALLRRGGQTVVGQITQPPLLDSLGLAQGTVRRQLHFVIPRMAANRSIKVEMTVGGEASGGGFTWQDTLGDHSDLLLDGKVVLRYMYKPLDESSAEARELTYKPFHHLFDFDEQMITKGAGGRYTHHRGLFFGFNRVTYGDGVKADVWHCRGDDHQSHEDVLAEEAGPVVGRQRVKIDWHGTGKEVFATEERELTVYNVPGGRLVEFASRVTPVAGNVKLDGDPQHAGFHFRASDEVAAKTLKETYYVRPDGRGAAGETRNWPGHADHVNLPWNAMSFMVGGKRYTAAYLDKPSNPKEARFSERDYGRFGSYFEYNLSEQGKLEVNYRIWLQNGEMSGADVERLSHDFVDPVRVTVAAEQ